MSLSDASNQRNRPVSRCCSPQQHGLAGCYTGDVGPCAAEERLGQEGVEEELPAEVGTESHGKLSQMLE